MSQTYRQPLWCLFIIAHCCIFWSSCYTEKQKLSTEKFDCVSSTFWMHPFPPNHLSPFPSDIFFDGLYSNLYQLLEIFTGCLHFYWLFKVYTMLLKKFRVYCFLSGIYLFTVNNRNTRENVWNKRRTSVTSVYFYIHRTVWNRPFTITIKFHFFFFYVCLLLPHEVFWRIGAPKI